MLTDPRPHSLVGIGNVLGPQKIELFIYYFFKMPTGLEQRGATPSTTASFFWISTGNLSHQP